MKAGRMMKNVTEMTDYEIVLACLLEDQEYFSEIVKRYKNLVYSVILRMTTDQEEANDLAQEVFMKIYLNLDKYYPEYQLSTWIIRITTNHVIDFRRKRRLEQVPLENVEYDLSSGDSPETSLIEQEQSELLAKLLEELPDIYSVPLVLFHEQGLSYKEIAEIIDEPLSKVKNRIYRGRRMLKDSILKGREEEMYGLYESR